MVWKEGKNVSSLVLLLARVRDQRVKVKVVALMGGAVVMLSRLVSPR